MGEKLRCPAADELFRVSQENPGLHAKQVIELFTASAPTAEAVLFVHVGFTTQEEKLLFVRSLLSLRASAHTGVAIPPLNGTR